MFDLTGLAHVDPDADESELIARIAELERVKAAAAAGQARAAAAFEVSRRSAEAEAGVPVRARGRGVASEVALARRDSPARGGRQLGFAKALVYEIRNAKRGSPRPGANHSLRDPAFPGESLAVYAVVPVAPLSVPGSEGLARATAPRPTR